MKAFIREKFLFAFITIKVQFLVNQPQNQLSSWNRKRMHNNLMKLIIVGITMNRTLDILWRVYGLIIYVLVLFSHKISQLLIANM